VEAGAVTALLQASGLRLPGRLEETGLELLPGTLTCLVGPNGSGKTSLLHALAGIGSPSGVVRIGGADPHALPPRLRQQLYAYLPASRDVAWPLSASDLVALGVPEPDPPRIEALLRMFELENMAARRIDRLSTGERSRVLIARALAARPRLLLLDEPASNLDPLWQLRLMDLLHSEARGNGQAVLMAVHDLELARDHADRLIVMDKGRIAADGAPDEVLDSEVVPAVFGIERANGRWRPV
jgi:iron complex transport system ATP-binding protein